MNHQVNHSNLNHRFTADRQRLIIFTQSPILAQPRKGPFYHPSSGQYRKALNILTTFDNLQHPATKIKSPVNELACISTISPNQGQTIETTQEFLKNHLGTVTILNIGRVHNYRHQKTQGIDHQMAFSPRYLLASVVTFIPPFEAVLTDWLSIIAALGQGWRPTCTRTRLWSVS